MEVAREAIFSDRDQIILLEAITVLKVHTESDIPTHDGTQITPGIVDGSLDDRTSCYNLTRPLPWKKSYSNIMQKLIHHLMIGTKHLLTYLSDFNNKVQHSHKYLWLNPRPQLGMPPAGGRVHHLQLLGEFKHRPSRYYGTSCTDDTTVCYEGGKYLQGSGVSLVLDFANDGSSSHECFIMVLVVLRIRQSILFISGRGTYVGTRKSIKIEGLIK